MIITDLFSSTISLLSVVSFNQLILSDKEVAKSMLYLTTCVKGFKPILKEKLVLPDKYDIIWKDNFELEVKVCVVDI